MKRRPVLLAPLAVCATLATGCDAAPTRALRPPAAPVMAAVLREATITRIAETGEVRALNGAGTVVGARQFSSSPLEIRGFRWSGSGGLEHLGTLGVPGNASGYAGYSFATSINDNGEVVGYSVAPDGYTHAVRWSAQGAIEDLGLTVPSIRGRPFSMAQDINVNGWIVGGTSYFDGGHRAFLWIGPGKVYDLGTLGGSVAEATAINDLGQIVGSATTSDGGSHPFLWTPNDPTDPSLGGVMEDLQPAGVTNVSFVPLDINNLGDIVGMTGAFNPGFFKPAGRSIQMLPEMEYGARGINDHGLIVGGGKVRALDGTFFTLPIIGTSPWQVVPWKVNNSNQIAGYISSNPEGTIPVLWTVAIDYPTPIDVIEGIIIDVRTLVGSGTISGGAGAALTQTLEAANRQLNGDPPNTTAAINVLNAFIVQTEAFAQRGAVSAADAQRLIDETRALITSLGGTPR